MGDSNYSQQLLDHQETLPTTKAACASQNYKKLSIIPFIFLIYFEVSGGAYGAEAAVGAAGPLCSILGFLIFPFLWSIPEALITAELATTFPGNGGYVIWAHQAFGPFWGLLIGSWKFVSGVINLASCSVLCIEYIKLVLPLFSCGASRYFAVVSLALVLSFLNYTGLVLVGYTAILLGIFSLLPFILLALISIPNIDPSRWISLNEDRVKTDWSLFFNTHFWNLNFWDNASSLAGEVDRPQKTFPKALFSAGLLTCLAYLVPLLAATGAMPLKQENWVNGYFADVAQIIAGTTVPSNTTTAILAAPNLSNPMATVVGAASNPLSNPIVSMVDGVSSKAFDEVLKATPPALSAFLAGLPSIKANEKSPQLDDGDSGFPPRDDDGGRGGGGGGGGNWSGELFLFGFLAFLGFLKDKESEEDYRDNRRR